MSEKEKQGFLSTEHLLTPSVPSDTDKDKEPDTSHSRRAFIKTAVIGAVVATSSAGFSKIITSAAPKGMQLRMHTNDDIQQEKIMLRKEYVLMTEEEKNQMLQMLIRDYKEQA